MCVGINHSYMSCQSIIGDFYTKQSQEVWHLYNYFPFKIYAIVLPTSMHLFTAMTAFIIKAPPQLSGWIDNFTPEFADLFLIVCQPWIMHQSHFQIECLQNDNVSTKHKFKFLLT